MDTRNAGIALVSMVRKITNKITVLDFIQSEPVSDVVKPATYRLFFISEDNERISNENSYIADNRDQDAQKRIFRMSSSSKIKSTAKTSSISSLCTMTRQDLRYSAILSSWIWLLPMITDFK